jgi:ribonuclease P protein component
MRRRTNRQFAFPKTERLHSQKLITELFSQKNDEKSSTVFLYPFKLVCLWQTIETDNPVAPINTYPPILISVPKKSFRRAVHRNRLRRQIREIYRVNRIEVLPKALSIAAICIVYVAKKAEPFVFMQSKLKKALSQVAQTKRQQNN